MLHRLVAVWLRLLGIRWDKGQWIMRDREIIPEYVIIGYAIITLVGLVGIVIVLGVFFL